MEIGLVLALVLINGLLAMSEIAIVTARKARLQRFVDEGDRGAKAAIKLGEDPTRFLSTIQIGITSIGILNGIFGEAALAGPLAGWLREAGVRDALAGTIATALVVVIVTYVSIVIGELVPKRLGQVQPERIARVVARPISWIATASTPFVRLLSGSTNLLLRMLGAHKHAPTVTEEEIEAMLVEGSEAGVIEPHEQVMVRNLFRLDDRHIASFMIPRRAITTLDLSRPVETNLDRVANHEHARYPLLRGGWQDVVGIVRSHTLLTRLLRHEPVNLETAAAPVMYVPETVTGMELLESFRRSGQQQALVVDEYGEVLGLVTLRDLIEAITGEFKPQQGSESWAVRRDDGSWLLDGLIPIPEMKDRLGLRTVPEEERAHYHTLSGMMLVLLGRVPKTGDHAQWEGWRFEVVDMDGRRIDKVLAAALPTPSADGATTEADSG